MQTTSNYDLQIYEGADIFNPLIVENQNMEAIDAAMYENSITCVGTATELKSGTVHALTRTDHPECPVFRFVATSKYELGDTFTVDTIQVTALLTDGTPLSEGAYVIGANVLCCLTGTTLTMYTVPGAIQTAQNALRLGGELPSYYGTAQDTQTALNTANAAGVLANNLNTSLTSLITGTLLSGQTTLTLTDSRIKDSSIVDPYFWSGTGVANEPISYKTITVSNGSITFEFDEFDTNIDIGVRVM